MTGDALRVTIAICTHNRASLLRRTLDSVRQLRVDERVTLSVLVVANACTDDTPSVLQQWQGSHALRWIAEPTPGLSVARNRVLSELKAEPPDLLLWIDDDVILPTHWAQAYVNASRAYPEINVFGGPIDPHFEGANSQWINDRLDVWGVAFARLDFGTDDLEMSNGKWLPFGANFGVRFSAIRDCQFDTRLGVRLQGRLVGEETEFLLRVLNEKRMWRYVAQSRVAHIIPAERQSLDFIKRYFRGVGATEEISNCLAGRHARVLGLPPWLILAVPVAYLKRARYKWLQSDIRAHAKAYARSQILVGRCIQARAADAQRATHAEASHAQASNAQASHAESAANESKTSSSSWATPS